MAGYAFSLFLGQGYLLHFSPFCYDPKMPGKNQTGGRLHRSRLPRLANTAMVPDPSVVVCRLTKVPAATSQSVNVTNGGASRVDAIK